MVTDSKNQQDAPSPEEIAQAKFLDYMSSQNSGVKSDAQVLSEFRELKEDFHASYFGGSSTRFLPKPRGVNPLGTNADFHYPSEVAYFLMVERGRFYDRDNMIFGAALNRVISNIFQTGFKNEPETGDDALNEDLGAGWDEYCDADNFDYEQEMDFTEATETFFRNTLVDGDLLYIPTNRNGRIEMIENHHMRNPFNQRNVVSGSRSSKTGIVHGVELNNGKRVAYHLTPDNVGLGYVSKRFDTKRRPVRNSKGERQIHHVYLPKRKSQRRGVTVTAPIVFPLQYNDDLQFAAMVNAKKQSFIAILRELAASAAITPGAKRTSGTREDFHGDRRPTKDGSPGQEYISKTPGEKVSAFAHNTPAPQHFHHTDLLMTLVSINIDLPLIVLLLDATKSNFNGYRGAIEQARLRYRQLQSWSIRKWHSPIYRHYIRWRLKRDPRLRTFLARKGTDVFAHSFTPEGWDYIQPVQDGAADALQLDRNLTSARRRARKRGTTWKKLSQEIVEDRSLLIRQACEKAEELNNEFPEANVNWREIAFGQESGIRVNLNGTIDGEESESKQDGKQNDNQ